MFKKIALLLLPLCALAQNPEFPPTGHFTLTYAGDPQVRARKNHPLYELFHTQYTRLATPDCIARALTLPSAAFAIAQGQRLHGVRTYYKDAIMEDDPAQFRMDFRFEDKGRASVFTEFCQVMPR